MSADLGRGSREESALPVAPDLAPALDRMERNDDDVGFRGGWPRRAGSPSAHKGFPVLDAGGSLVGVVTRREVLRAAAGDGERTIGTLLTRAPVVVYDDSTLRDAADHMVVEKVGRLPVVTRERPEVVVGIVTAGDLLAAHAPRLAASRRLKYGRGRS